MTGAQRRRRAARRWPSGGREGLTESEDLNAETEDDDGLEVASVANDHTGESCAERAGERGELADAGGGLSGLVARDDDCGGSEKIGRSANHAKGARSLRSEMGEERRASPR